MKKTISRLMICTILAVSASGCTLTDGQKKALLVVGAVVAVAAVAYVACKDGGCGGGGGYAPASNYSTVETATVTDYSWEWDEFYRYGSLVWACRGVQTGQFAHNYRCAGKTKTDWKWPAKSA